MFPFLRTEKTSRDRDNLVRDEYIKKKLKNELATAVKELQGRYVSEEDWDIPRNDEFAQYICTILEAIFLHGYTGKHLVSGLKNFFREQHATDGIPEVSFWSLVKEVTHKDVITQLKHLVVMTEVGLCRAWIRLALNDNLMDSYLDAILSDKENLSAHYSVNASLMDPEFPFIVIELLRGLSQFHLNLNYNSSKLNAWNSEPLELCGLLPSEKRKHREPQCQEQSRKRSISQKQISNQGNSNKVERPTVQKSDTVDSDRPSLLSQEQGEVTDVSNVFYETCTPSGQESVSLEGDNAGSGSQGSSHEVASPSRERTRKLTGNQIGAGDDLWSGWSSAFAQAEHNHSPDQDKEPGPSEQPVASPANVAQESFDTLLKTFGNKFNSDQAVRGNSLKSEGNQNTRMRDQTQPKHPKKRVTSPSEDESLRDMNYEIVSHGINYDGSSESRCQLERLHVIAVEKGLDKQNFQCKGCGRPVGLIYGPHRVCHFDGWYYCIECHADEEAILPARIIQNWDFTPMKVSKYNKSFLIKIEEEPLFHIDEINPTLYNAVRPLNETKILRIQLQSLKAYVFTCQNELIEDFRRRIWPREYLCDDIHQYSIADLVQANNGQLATHLKKIIAQFSRHVYKCSLCSQKGFICEICGDEKIIYPFEILTTVQCHRCQSLFHKSCKESNRCPKCIRLQFRAKKDESPGNGQEKIFVSQSNDSNLGEIGVL